MTGYNFFIFFSLALRDWSCGIDKLKELAAGCDAELLSSPSGSSLDEGQQGAERNIKKCIWSWANHGNSSMATMATVLDISWYHNSINLHMLPQFLPLSNVRIESWSMFSETGRCSTCNQIETPCTAHWASYRGATWHHWYSFNYVKLNYNWQVCHSQIWQKSSHVMSIFVCVFRY